MKLDFAIIVEDSDFRLNVEEMAVTVSKIGAFACCSLPAVEAGDLKTYDRGCCEVVHVITRERIRTIRNLLFELAKQAPSLEIMHWYMWLDECFENDEFDPSDFSNLQWRCWVLKEKEEPVGALIEAITPLLKDHQLI